mgnify:FL=1
MAEAQPLELRSRFPGVISLLRFFRAANQLYMIDRFANAPDSHTALEVLREMESIVLRLTPETIKVDNRQVRACLHDRIRESEAELYRRLGAIVGRNERNELIFAVRCPKLPTDKELDELRRALDSYELRPAELAALAMAWRVKG